MRNSTEEASVLQKRGDGFLIRASQSLLPRTLPQKAKRLPPMMAARRKPLYCQENLERAKGLEPSTPTLARSCSTTELHPHPRCRRSRESTRNNAQTAPNGPYPLVIGTRAEIGGRSGRFATFRTGVEGLARSIAAPAGIAERCPPFDEAPITSGND
jgi:hypothetical protein